MPGSVMFQHSIHNNEEFVHAGDQCHLLGFTGGTESIVQFPDYRVKSCSYQSSHIEYCPDLGSTSPRTTSATLGSAVMIQGSDSNKSGNLFTVQITKFRKFNDQSGCEARSYSGYALQAIVLFALYRAFFNPSLQIGIKVSQIFLHVGNKINNSLFHRLMCGMEAVLFSSDHLNQLPASCQNSSQLLRFLIRQWTWLWFNYSRKMRQYTGIYRVCFGEFFGGFSKISGLTWINHRTQDASSFQRISQLGFVTTSRFHDYKLNRQFIDNLHKLVYPNFVVSEAPSSSGLIGSNIQNVFRHIYTNMILFQLTILFLARSYMIRSRFSVDQTTVRAHPVMGETTMLKAGLFGPRMTRSVSPLCQSTIYPRYKNDRITTLHLRKNRLPAIHTGTFIAE